MKKFGRPQPANRFLTASLSMRPSTVNPDRLAITAFITRPMSFTLAAPVSVTAASIAAAMAPSSATGG